MSLNRRTFLKSSVGGAAGITLAGAGMKTAFASSEQGQGVVWTDKMPINPNIDNMRVVCMHDPKMCDVPEGNSLKLIQKATHDDVVRANMDQMAMELTGKATADEAWKTIFRSGKAWKDTKIMLKVNAVEKIMLPRVSVIKTFTDIFVSYGVLPENIIMFDGQGAGWNAYADFVSLTDVTKIRCVNTNDMLKAGGEGSVTIPNITGMKCPKYLLDGGFDIIVNIAVNKGHASPTFGVGLTTLCLKNHFGTFLDKNKGMAMKLHNTDALININKIAPIIGGNPVRQQLCFIDSLWGAASGPATMNGLKFDNTEKGKLNRLAMGTFAGAVDYCFVKKVRETIMGVTHDDNIPKFITGFGYKETDPVWVEMTPTGATTEKVNHPAASKKVSFTMSNTSLRQSTIRFSIPSGTHDPLRTRIFDMRGSLVVEMQSPAGATAINWDGKATNGSRIGVGNYVVDISTGSFRIAERLTVMR
jgi:hypothetical protein